MLFLILVFLTVFENHEGTIENLMIEPLLFKIIVKIVLLKIDQLVNNLIKH